MARRYFRRPGYSPTYSKFQTARYMSRRARLTRGLYMKPSWKDLGRLKFYFFSPRGPHTNNGHWEVSAVYKDSFGGDDGGGGGGDVSDSPSGLFCPAEGTGLTLEMTCHRYVVTRSPWLVASAGGRVDQSAFPLADYVYPYSYTLGGWRVSERSGYQTSSGDWVWWWTEWRLRNISHVIYDGDVAPNPNSSFYWQPAEHYPFEVVGVTGPDINYFQADGYESPWCSYTPAGGGSEPPTELPPGYIEGAGPMAYKCDCPDFTGIEPRHLKPNFRSQARTRDFSNRNTYRVTGFPCKHIVSAAAALGDLIAIADWTGTARYDLPAFEYWQNYQTAWDEWNDDFAAAQQQRQVDEKQAQAEAELEAAQRAADYLADTEMWGRREATNYAIFWGLRYAANPDRVSVDWSRNASVRGAFADVSNYWAARAVENPDYDPMSECARMSYADAVANCPTSSLPVVIQPGRYIDDYPDYFPDPFAERSYADHVGSWLTSTSGRLRRSVGLGPPTPTTNTGVYIPRLPAVPWGDR